MQKRQFLIPGYLENFRCIGSSCEDTCCKGWKVPLDKKTYKNYKKTLSKNTNISPEHLVLNKDSSMVNDYGYIKMKNDGECPYLSHKKLCSIHSELGEEWLSYTCYSYPRIVNEINGLYEMSATISCPEIARLALLNEELMEFKDISMIADRDYIASITLNHTDDFDENTEIMHYFWPLRIFTISTLQDRRYELDERLILLGLVYKKILGLSETNELTKVITTIENYTELFDDVTQMKDMISGKKESGILPFSEEFVRELHSLRGEDFYTATDYLEIVKNIIDSLSIDNSEFIIIQQKYKEYYNEYYEPYMSQKEYILENYLVNEVFKEFYPFAKTESIDSSFKMLLSLYNIIKFHLIGISGHHSRLDDEITVRTIQAFSKAVLHHKNYLKIFVSE